jgi:hypothetical protein
MIEQEDVKIAPPLSAAQYRRAWLNDAHTLGQIAETLAEVLGWQPTAEQMLPDPLELAQEAATRIGRQETRVAPSKCLRRRRARAEMISVN